MSNKTAFGYNEDNFIQENEVLKELAVTITLGEYRYLLQTVACNEKDIEQLQNKIKNLERTNKELKKLNENLAQLCLSQNPDVLKNYVDKIKYILSKS